MKNSFYIGAALVIAMIFITIWELLGQIHDSYYLVTDPAVAIQSQWLDSSCGEGRVPSHTSRS